MTRRTVLGYALAPVLVRRRARLGECRVDVEDRNVSGPGRGAVAEPMVQRGAGRGSGMIGGASRVLGTPRGAEGGASSPQIAFPQGSIAP